MWANGSPGRPSFGSWPYLHLRLHTNTYIRIYTSTLLSRHLFTSLDLSFLGSRLLPRVSISKRQEGVRLGSCKPFPGAPNSPKCVYYIYIYIHTHIYIYILYLYARIYTVGPKVRITFILVFPKGLNRNMDVLPILGHCRQVIDFQHLGIGKKSHWQHASDAPKYVQQRDGKQIHLRSAL